ncbi:MAG: ABC transporter ATP-binding protein/permease [Treponema sp.]|nr:ABC transporter ATP-binding protein/permease [Treponema sp.]
MKNNKNSKNKTISKVLKLTHRLQPGHIALIIISRIISVTSRFIPIVLSSIILDQLISKAPFETIFKTSIILVVSSGFLGMIYWGLQHILSVNNSVMAEKIDQMLCSKTFNLDYDILEKQETLDLIKKAEEGIRSRGDFSGFCENFAGFIENIISIVYSIALLIPLFIPKASSVTGFLPVFLNKWYSFVVLVIMLALSVLVSALTKKKEEKIQQDMFVKNVRINREYGYLFNLIFDYANAKYIRLYKSQKLIENRSQKLVNFLETEFNKMFIQINKCQLPVFFVNALLQIVSYLYVGLKAIFGFLSVGSALKYISAYSNLVEAVSSIFYSYIEINIKAEYLSYFYDYMEIENKQYEGTIPTEKRDDNEFEIEFRDVSFRYPNTENYVLRHVNQKIKIGTKTAVVGKNGAGKTTFIKLLCRLYEPTEGQILLNGVDIRYYDYKDYARLFSVVFQDFNLFSFSIAENVAGGIDFDEDRVKDCLERSGFGERLSKMPNGINTNIYQHNDDGVEISGGEAQKIAIARALYKDAPLVILDEPTSALDPVSEYEIYQHFDSMVQDKTSIYISHRMSSCRFCDNIIVFDQGKIVEQGSHEELMTCGGLYSELWNAQAQYYA